MALDEYIRGWQAMVEIDSSPELLEATQRGSDDARHGRFVAQEGVEEFFTMYKPDYTEEFLSGLKKYASLRKLAWKNIRQILQDPLYHLRAACAEENGFARQT